MKTFESRVLTLVAGISITLIGTIYAMNRSEMAAMRQCIDNQQEQLNAQALKIAPLEKGCEEINRRLARIEQKQDIGDNKLSELLLRVSR